VWGGKVSFYNQTPNGPIKPTPLIGVLGLSDKKPRLKKIASGDLLIIVGETKDELGGSEYYEYIHDFIGGNCPKVDFKSSKENMDSILDVIRSDLTKSVHDCSKGGLVVAISEYCMLNQIGCKILLNAVPAKKLSPTSILFSESHSRYLLVIDPRNLHKVKQLFVNRKIKFGIIGKFNGINLTVENYSENILNVRIDKAHELWISSLEEMLHHG